MPTSLTAVAVASAKPRTARYEMSESGGLRLVIQPSGAKSWAYRYRREDGTSAKLTIGPYPAVDLKTARAKALQAAAEVADKKDPSADKRAARAAAKLKAKPPIGETVAAAIEAFEARHGKVNNRESHWKETRRILNLVLAPWATRRPGDVTKRDIHTILDAAMDRGAPTMANRTLAALRSFFGWAAERELVSVSPCAGIGAPSPTKTRERTLDWEELAAVWRAAEKLGHPFGPIVRLLILTGQRRGEVASIRAIDVDLEAASWSIPATVAKNGRAHSVYLTEAAADIVREARKRERVGDYLFGAETPPSGWSKAKRRLDTEIGEAIALPWTLHDIRRSVATGLASQGVALPVIERLLNHVSGTFAGIVGTYQRHEFFEERKAALTGWAETLTGLTA